MTTVDSEEPALPEPAGAGTEATATATTAKPTTTAPARKPEGLGPLLLRLHFYAGILVAPFLLIAATTGLLFTSRPPSTRSSTATNSSSPTAGDKALPVAQQVAAARAAHPEGDLTGVRPGENDATTQVDFTSPALSVESELSTRCTSTRTPPRSPAS